MVMQDSSATSAEPEYLTHEECQNRLRKLEELRELGIAAYPHKYNPTHHAFSLKKELEDQPVGDSKNAEEGETPTACLAGRLILFRAMGKNAFGHIQDATGQLQVMFNRNLTKLTGYEGEETTPLKIIEKKLDLGDIIGVKGHLFRTMKGELTLLVTECTLLTKSLLPLPDKHSGLADKEQRYRKRWLDLIANSDVRETFLLRSRILRRIREELDRQQFIEVETPCLQKCYGGANAAPFTTELHALHQQMFLRISLEPSLKKLLVGGLERIFEMSKVFRNEGIDRTHNPEFTMLELYAAYWDYNDHMVFMENLMESIALDLFGTTKIPCLPKEGEEPVLIEMKAPWKRMTMRESIQEYAGVDVDSMSDQELLDYLASQPGIDREKVKDLPRGLLVSEIFEAKVEEHLIQPHHITDHPIETTPLCKPHRDEAEREKGIVERFESFVMGKELCNAYSELNDPLIQRQLLEDQAAKRDAGDDEAVPMDEEFLEAIYQGMPPAGGLGIGIDRLVMLFTRAASIRDVLYFPWMK